MSIVLSLCHEHNSMLPLFGLIKSVFVNEMNKPFAICNQFNTLYFDDHYQSYNVTLTNSLICICLEDLEIIYPTHHCSISNGLLFIPLKL